MKRVRPKQHYRVIKTKKGRKRILINKGIKKNKVKKRIKNYGFFTKSTNWVGLSQEKKRKQNQEDVQIIDGKLEIIPDDLKPKDVLKFIDLEKGFSELENHGINVDIGRRRDIRQSIRLGDLDKAYALMPREGKLFANLARGNPASHLEKQKTRIGRPVAIKMKRY